VIRPVSRRTLVKKRTATSPTKFKAAIVQVLDTSLKQTRVTGSPDWRNFPQITETANCTASWCDCPSQNRAARPVRYQRATTHQENRKSETEIVASVIVLSCDPVVNRIPSLECSGPREATTQQSILQSRRPNCEQCREIACTLGFAQES
jgi:hypothetical protein